MSSMEKAKGAIKSFADAEHIMPLAIQFISATVLIIALNQSCPTGGCDKYPNYTYATTAASIAMVFTAIGILLVSATELYDRDLFQLPGSLTLTVGKLLAIFLFIWWIVAAGVITFDGPFTSSALLANGYFSAWVGFIFSVVGLGVRTKHITSAMATSGASTIPMLSFFASSFVVMIAAARHLDQNKPTHHDETVFALIVALFSMVVSFAFLVLEQMGKADAIATAKLWTLILFATIWIVEACVVSFRGPFLTIDNGYCASWASVVLCLRAAFPEMADSTAAQPQTVDPGAAEANIAVARAAAAKSNNASDAV